MNQTLVVVFVLLCILFSATSQAISWSRLTAETLSQLDPSVFIRVPDADIRAIKPSACVGFRTEQLDALFGSSCAGFTVFCLANIPTNSIPGFTKQCVQNFAQNAVSGFSADQITALTVDAIQGLTSDHFKHIKGESCSGFLEDQVQAFQPVVCSEIRAACFQKLTGQAIAGFSGQCAIMFRDDALHLISADQLSHFSPAAVNRFSPATMQRIVGTMCSGFTGDQISSLNMLGCGVLGSECFKNIDTSHFANFTRSCLSNLASGSFSSISSDQMASIAPSAISAIPNQVWAEVNPSSCAGLTSEEIAEITFGCEFMSTACIASISPDSFSGFTGFCIVRFPTETVLKFTDSQLAYLNPDAVSQLSSSTVIQLIKQRKAAFVDIWGMNQTAYFPDNLVLAVKQAILTKMVPEKQITREKLATITWLQMAFTSVQSAVKVLNRASITRMVPNGIRGIQGNVLAQLPNDIFADLSLPQIAAVFSDALEKLSAAQISYIAAEGFGSEGIGARFEYIPASLMPSLSDTQLLNAMVNFDYQRGVTCDQFKAFTAHQHKLIQNTDEKLDQTLSVWCSRPHPIASESSYNPITSESQFPIRSHPIASQSNPNKPNKSKSYRYIAIWVGFGAATLLVLVVVASIITLIVVKSTQSTYTRI